VYFRGSRGPSRPAGHTTHGVKKGTSQTHPTYLRILAPPRNLSSNGRSSLPLPPPRNRQPDAPTTIVVTHADPYFRSSNHRLARRRVSIWKWSRHPSQVEGWREVVAGEDGQSGDEALIARGAHHLGAHLRPLRNLIMLQGMFKILTATDLC
jgi:hypothetical protein